jgi:hypothetical protein
LINESILVLLAKESRGLKIGIHVTLPKNEAFPENKTV